DIGLRAVDRIGPVHRHGAVAIARLATLPVLFSHMHPERRPHLLGVGDNVDLVPARGKRVGGPIGAHADAALDGRKFTYNAYPHLQFFQSLVKTAQADVQQVSNIPSWLATVYFHTVPVGWAMKTRP